MQKEMELEKEIDALFLGQESTNIQEGTIKELEDCSTKLGDLDPYINIIKGKMGSIKMDYDLYHIKLERLAKEMESIEEENTKLENEILYQTSIYNSLKDLLINLEIKEEHFISLETDPLDTPEGISRIEKALYALSNFNIQDYSIRVVREKKERVETALRLFYKRFIQFLSKFFMGRESSEELKVHKDLYKRMKAFKDIYAYSKKYHDFYAVLCTIYIKHAKNLYAREMEYHLSRIHKLLSNSPDKIENSLSALLQSYRSIINCEVNFLKSMSIESDGMDIFENSSKILLGFIQDVYYVSALPTLNYLDLNWVEVPQNEKVYLKFQEDLKGLVGNLKKKLINKELSEESDERVDRFKEFLKESKLKDLNRILYSFNRDNILRESCEDVFETIERKRILEELFLVYSDGEDSTKEEYLQSINQLDETFKKLLIDFVYAEGGDFKGKIKKVLSKINGSEMFKKEMHKQIYEILSETVEDKEELERIMK